MTDYGVEGVVVVGGTGAVSSAVYDQLSAMVGGNIVRVSGEDRYATAKALVDWEIEWCQHEVATDRMVVVAGESWADALLTVPLASSMFNAPVLLTRGTELSPEVEEYIDEYAPMQEISFMVGGTGRITRSVFDAWNEYGRPFGPSEPMYF